VIPRTLRAAYGRHELPAWLRDAAGLPDGARVESLEPDLDDSGLERLGHRVELYLFRLLDSNRAAARHVRVLDRPWPSGLDPDAIAWPATAQRLREWGQAADAASLSRVTYGELLAVPRVGARAVVAFAAAAEAALDRAYAGIDAPPELAALERRVAAAGWAAQVDSTDPRFAGVLPPGAGALATSARWRLREVCERVASIDRATLDVALRDYVGVLGELDGERLEAVLGRLGLDGRPPRSLANAVNGSGITPERIRQLQIRTLARRPAHPVYMPALDRALAHLAALAPCTAQVAADSLRASGIASIPFHPASVLAAAQLCGVRAEIALQPAANDEIVVDELTGTWTPALVRLAAQRTGRFGAASVSELAAAAGGLPTEVVRRLVTTLMGASFLAGDWFWLPHLPSSRLTALTFRMLAVRTPLEVTTVHAGVSRAYRRRHAHLVPPAMALGALYRAHPSFAVDADGLVRAAGPVDFDRYLGKHDRLFVEVLGEARSGVLDVVTFRDACVRRGMTTHMFAFARTYSPILDNLTGDLWCLRGRAAAP
jgi:hypothetical protein